MSSNEAANRVTDFKVLFNYLDQAKANQPSDVQISLKEDEDIKATLDLFKEYQDAELQGSFTTVTVG